MKSYLKCYYQFMILSMKTNAIIFLFLRASHHNLVLKIKCILLDFSVRVSFSHKCIIIMSVLKSQPSFNLQVTRWT